MEFMELYFKLKIIGEIIGVVLVSAFILFWVIVYIILKFKK